jgi:hypothetical protein
MTRIRSERAALTSLGRVFMPWMTVIHDVNNQAVTVKTGSAQKLRIFTVRFTVKTIRLEAIDAERPLLE